MSADPAKRGHITAEHAAEAERLRALWNSKRRQSPSKLTQEKAGLQFDIGTQAAVGHFLNGRAALSAKAAAGFARALNCQVADFSPRLAKVLETPSGGDLTADEELVLRLFKRLDPKEQRRYLAIISAAFPDLLLAESAQS